MSEKIGYMVFVMMLFGVLVGVFVCSGDFGSVIVMGG